MIRFSHVRSNFKFTSKFHLPTNPHRSSQSIDRITDVPLIIIIQIKFLQDHFHYLKFNLLEFVLSKNYSLE